MSDMNPGVVGTLIAVGVMLTVYAVHLIETWKKTRR